MQIITLAAPLRVHGRVHKAGEGGCLLGSRGWLCGRGSAVTGFLFLPEIQMKNKQFIAELIPSDLLDTALDWIGDNLSPDQVFDEDVLFDWCKSNTHDAEDVCPDILLYEWAGANDYVVEK